MELARQLNGGAAKMYRSQLRSSHEQLGALTKQVLDGQRKAELRPTLTPNPNP